MYIKSVKLKPLATKHYSTDIEVWVEDAKGYEYALGIKIFGYFPSPSQRELDGGWDVEQGMDHVETQAEYEIGLAIVKALKEKANW